MNFICSEVVGPALGGYLDEYYGFDVCCTVMAGLCLGMGIIFSLYIVIERVKDHLARKESAILARRAAIASWRTATSRRQSVIDRSRRQKQKGLNIDETSGLSSVEPCSMPHYGTYPEFSRIDEFASRGIPIEDEEEEIPALAISV